ncbi:MAG TPA: SpoIIE family protein phosphatase [Acidimicrobiales bacterium]
MLTTTAGAPGGATTGRHDDPGPHPRLLLVEDDDRDARAVRALLDSGLPGARVERVCTLAEAGPAAARADCVLLDLDLPDARGTSGVARLVAMAPDTPVVVLTATARGGLGIDAVAAGAQDYLVKDRVDDQLLARSVQYAVERQRAARLARELYQADRQRADNMRMERALAPPPRLRSDDLDLAVRYRAGREGAELGGDFYDAVEHPDGTVTLLIGDVAGQGPDAAALGARLRSAWRALTLAGLDQRRVLTTLDTFLRSEVETLTFATMATFAICPDRRSGVLLSAGHPPPLLLAAGRMRRIERPGHLLGVVEAPRWAPLDVALCPGTSVLLYTDGLFEGRAAPGSTARLGIEALTDLAAGLVGDGLAGAALLDALLEEVQRRNGGPLTDDVALCLASTPDPPPAG